MARPRKIAAIPLPASVVSSSPDDGLVEVVSIINARLHLGDGRKLEWREAARVEPELAAFLEERGQVKRV